MKMKACYETKKAAWRLITFHQLHIKYITSLMSFYSGEMANLLPAA